LGELEMRFAAVTVAVCMAACATRTSRDVAIDYMALYYAAAAGNDTLVMALLKRGAPVDAPDPDSAGDISLQAVDFDSPLQAAAEGGHIEIVQVLLSHRPWVDHRCCDRPSALGMAASKGHLKIVELLLAAGADPAVPGYYGDQLPSGTPVDAARAAGHMDVVHALESARKVPK
jgi:ankyrin repeat protein